MARPVFFSVGGAQDARFAASVKEHLPDAMVYMYTRTGEEGTAFLPEIEKEIQACRLFVVFWSDDYLASTVAMQELAQARRLSEGPDKGKQALIVPTRHKVPNFSKKWVNPIGRVKEQEYVLGAWRFERALDPTPDPQKVAEIIRRKLEAADVFGRTLVPRTHVVDEIRKAVSRPDYTANEFVYVSGLEGDGRRTALKQFIRASHENLVERQVAFDSAEGPEDLLISMMESVGLSVAQRNKILGDIEAEKTSALKEIRKLVHQARASKNYFVILLDRFTGADTVGIPDWVSEVFGKLQFGNAPLVFLVTSSPITDARLSRMPSATRARVLGLDEHQMGELVHRLSVEDPKRAQWTPERKKLIERVCGSSPSLCQIVMRSLRGEPTLDFVERIAAQEEEKFSSNMSAVLGHIVQQFKGQPDDIMALRVIDRLGIVSKAALDEILEPIGSSKGYDLYRMLEYGLLERLSDEMLRVPPLIQRRLGYILEDAAPDAEVVALLKNFAAKASESAEDYGAIFAANKAFASLVTGVASESRFSAYLTTASLFKAGLEKYLAHDFTSAHSILGRAMSRIETNASVDVSARIEIARYFGLSAARAGFDIDVDRACAFLGDALSDSPRAKQGAAMAAFLRGFQKRQRGHYREAIEAFEEAKDALKDIRFAERQRGAVLTELSRAFLRCVSPNYEAAVRYAEQAYTEKDVAHNLSGLIRAKLHRTFSKKFSDDSALKREMQAISKLLLELKAICARTDRDFHLFREAEYELVQSIRVAMKSGEPIDLSRSIRAIREAARSRLSHRNQFALWKYRVLDGRGIHDQALLAETRAVINRGAQGNAKEAADAAKIWAMVRAKKDKRDALETLHQHRNEMGPWARSFLERCIKAGGGVGLGDVFVVVDRL